MREAVGSSMLFYIVITFLIIYISFIAFIMNYASAYRAANYVITQIEACQGNLEKCNNTTISSIEKEITQKYRYVVKNGNTSYCCFQNAKGDSIYRVTLKVEFDLPLIGRVNPFSVKAETKTIYGVPCSASSFTRCK